MTLYKDASMIEPVLDFLLQPLSRHLITTKEAAMSDISTDLARHLPETNKRQKEGPMLPSKGFWPILENTVVEFLLLKLITWVSQRGSWSAVLFPPYKPISFNACIFLKQTGYVKNINQLGFSSY